MYQFKGRLLKLLTQVKKLPSGHKINLEMIEHPGAALIAPFLSKDKIIILRQYRAVIDKYIYELPAGTLDKNETPLSCAKREIIEETGYSASRFTRLGAIFPAPGYSTEKITIYKAEGLKKVKTSHEQDEVIAVKIVTRKQIQRLIKTGKIVDAKTICGLVFSKIFS